jgi:hypothetical protein
MLSDVFWTGLFTFGGSAVGAGAGYMTALLQRRSEDGRRLLEERRIVAASEQERQLRLEEFHQARHALYLTYLENLDAILSPIFLESVDAPSLNRGFNLFMDAHCGIELAGNPEINLRAYDLNSLIENLVKDVLQALTEKAGPRAANDILQERAEAIREGRRDIVSLMADDIREVSVL